MSTNTLVLSICLAAWASVSFGQEAATLDVLFQQLLSPTATDKAAQTLLKRGTSDPATRTYLSTHLPRVIEAGGNGAGRQWLNAVRLAGQLRISEAAPALSKWISFEMGETSMAIFSRLDDNPAGKALSQIGDPPSPPW